MSTMWAFIETWLTPLSLFVFLNLTILTILTILHVFALQVRPTQQPRTTSALRISKPPALRTQITRTPSLLERLKSKSDLYQSDSATPEPETDTDESEEHVNPDPPTQIARTPSILERLKSISFLFSSDSATTEPETDTEDDETDADESEDEISDPGHDHLVRRSKSDKVGHVVAKPGEKMTKSASEKWALERKMETASLGYDEEVDAKADDFINSYTTKKSRNTPPPSPPNQKKKQKQKMETLDQRSSTKRVSAKDSSTSRKERLRLLGRATLVLFTLFLLLDIVESRPFVSSRKVNPGVSTKSSYEVHQRLRASAEQRLRVFALEIVEGSDGGGEDDVSLQLEYQHSQETSTSRCQEEPMLNFRGNRGGSGRNEGGGEEGGGRDGSRGNGSGRRGGGGGGGDGGGGGGDGGDGGGGGRGRGGGGGGGGDGEGSDLESRGGDEKNLRPTLDILKLAIMSIAITAQTSGSAIALKVGGQTFLTKLLLVLVMTNNLVGYLCSMISVLLMHTRPRVARVLGVIGCAATALGFLILVVTFIQGLYNGE